MSTVPVPEELRREDLAKLHPRELRSIIRAGRWTQDTGGMAMGYTQTSVVILPKSLAFDFFMFCQRNPRPCPVLEVSEPGQPIMQGIAEGVDIRTDLPRYSVFKNGELVDTPTSIEEYWRDDLVTFLTGCSYSFEYALTQAGFRLRHLELGTIPAVYYTNIQCRPAGPFRGPMVVSMRPIPHAQVYRAVQVTSRFPLTHGAPVHVGDPAAIGIADLDKPDFGDPPRMRPGETPLFWGCTLTPSGVALASKPELLINHYVGRMLVTDKRVEETAII